MQRPTANDFDHASLEAMMERYRDELLRYQRATPPGKPTLAQNLEASERGRSAWSAASGNQPPTQSRPETQTRASQNRPPTVQTVVENKKVAAQPEVRREKIPVETPPIMLLPMLPPRFETVIQSEQETAIHSEQPAVILPQLPTQEAPPTAYFAPPAPLLVPLPQPVDTTSETGPMCAVAEETDSTAQQPQPPAVQTEPLPQPAPDIVLEPAEAPVPQSAPDSAAGPIPLIAAPFVETIPHIQPEQPSAPPENSRAVAPVPAEQPGCIAHTEFEKATGAYGVFRPYERMGRYTLASFLQTPGEAIQTLVRFAADVPVGSADAIRCRRSFTVKFFCREGEYDLFGMHLPVSVGTTEKALTDCCAVSRPSPKTGLRTRAAFWEFLVTHPEALHAAMWLYSDLGTIGSYRTIDGYGLPCLWVNAKNERRAVRPRWLSRQRPQTLTRFEAEELAGSDPDAVARDLVSSLQAGDRPQYELSIQIIEPEEFAALPFDPFDPTAIWPAEQFIPRRIGLLTLERPPDDARIELDCERFKPENIIPGIDHIPAPSKSGDDFAQVQQYLRSLGEFSRHRLIDNMSEELLRLPPLLLEQVLILFSRADLEYGQAVTLALGG